MDQWLDSLGVHLGDARISTLMFVAFAILLLLGAPDLAFLVDILQRLLFEHFASQAPI